MKLATANDFEATVIQFTLGNWSDAITKLQMQEFPTVKFIELSAMRSPFFPWLFSSILQKLCSQLPTGILTNKMLSIATGKRSFLLSKQLNGMKNRYDWVVAHNPAAFYPALIFSKRTGAKLGIDVEDYHPGETNDLKETKRIQQLMQRTLPASVYCSYASPLIAKKVKKDIPFFGAKQLVIINGFYGDEFILPQNNWEGPLRLVWFSQFIDRGRGLEQLLHIVDEFKDIELHLIGNMNVDFEKEFIGKKNNVFHHKAMQQAELHKRLSKFDIGLALEPGRDLNNQLAISNKLIAYVQAGLFIFASHTAAQDDFLINSNLYYLQTELTEPGLRECLIELTRQKADIRNLRKEQFEKGRQYDWENLSNELLNVWNS